MTKIAEEHKTYEALRDFMQAQLEEQRDTSNPKSQVRSAAIRMLFILAAYEKVGPRPIAHHFSGDATTPEAAEAELKAHRASMAEIAEWESRAEAAGLRDRD